MYDSHVTERSRFRVLVYSDDRDVRNAVVAALGTRPHPDLPEVEFVECATEPVVWQHLDDARRRPDLVVLDGESTPVGGLGVARQMKDEIFQAPPVLVLTGRPQDAWLATWSRADAAVSHPIDPLRLAEVFVDLARSVLQPG
jgi:CheY-like chemotaxis protein